MKTIKQMDTTQTAAVMTPPGEVMEMFVLYFDPSDYPNLYVIRRWEITNKGGRPTNAVWTYPTRIDAVNSMDERRPFLIRAENDDPTIVGVWL